MSKILRLAAVVVAVSLLGYAVGKGTFERYESTGMVAFDMDLSEYKRAYELVSNADTIQRFLVPKANGNAAAQFLLANAGGRDPLRRMMTPVYRATRADVRDLGDFREATKTTDRPIIGMRLAVSHPDPAVAQESVRLLADLVRQSIIKDIFTRYVADRGALAAERLVRTEGEFSRIRFDIAQAETKIADLKRIIREYPQASSVDQRQVVNLQKGIERFLSPVAQIIAEESRIIDLRSDEARFKRQLRQLKAEQQLLQQLLPADGTDIDGKALVTQSATTVAKVLAPMLKEDEAVQETLATYSADIAEMRGRWIDRSIFMAGPSLPTEPSGLSGVQAATTAGLMALLFGLLILNTALVRRVAGVVGNAFGFGTRT